MTTKTTPHTFKVGDRVRAPKTGLANIESEGSGGTVTAVGVTCPHDDAIQVKWDAAQFPLTYKAATAARITPATELTLAPKPATEEFRYMVTTGARSAQEANRVAEERLYGFPHIDWTALYDDKVSAEPTPFQYAAFGRYVAALLGANAEWDSAADYLEDIATAAHRKLGEEVGDQDEATFTLWRTIADELGIEHDGEEEETEEQD